MHLYLGIDGGQSSTKALLAEETGKVIGRGRGGPCNHAGSAEGRAKFLSAVGDCLRQAYHEAGIDSHSAHFASVCLGLSGGSEDKESYIKELIRSEPLQTNARRRNCTRGRYVWRTWHHHHCRHRIDRLWPQRPNANSARGGMGLHFRR